MQVTKYDILIIGSGLSGLLCGYILSREGFHVGILEKHSQPGGNLQTFTRRGNRFETGIHYIGGMDEGQTLWRYWKYFGLTGKLPLSRLDPDCFDKISYSDCEFPIAQGFDNFIDRLAPGFNGGRSELERYLKTISEIALKSPLYNLNVPGKSYGNEYSGQSAMEFYQSFTSKPVKKTTQAITLGSVLAGNNFLYGGGQATPMSVAALINHSYLSGAYRINGGSDQITQLLLQSVESAGGQVLVKKEVVKISRAHENFRVVTTANEPFEAKIVISSLHPAVTMSMLPQDMFRPVYRKRLSSLRNTTSSFILYLSLKPGCFPCLGHNFYYHSSANPWEESSSSGRSWPKMYLLTTGCNGQEGKYADSVTIMTFMRYDEVLRWDDSSIGRRGEGYLRFKYERADLLLNFVRQRFPELADAVVNMEVSTPLTWRDYIGVPEGSLYGIARDFANPLQAAVPARTKVPNLYFTGQNSNLHGAVGVTISAVMTCGEILGLENLMTKIKHA